MVFFFTAVHKSLDPVSVPCDNDEENEIMVVEATIAKDKKIRLINGYGPQESSPEATRKSFFTQLDLEIKKAKMAGALICVEMDSNAKLGPGFIPLDPKEQSDNGKLLATVILENNLVVVNGEELCKGAVTRYRETVNNIEESILDHFIVCREMFKVVTEMVIDEAGVYSLTKFANKSGTRTSVKPSDHRTMFLTTDLSWSKDTSKKAERVEVYNYKNSDHFKLFVEDTSDNHELRTCFDDDNEDLEKASSRWLKTLKTSIKKSFKKIRIKENRLNPELEKLFVTRETIMIKIKVADQENNLDKAIELRKELNQTNSVISKISAEKNRTRVRELLDDDDDSEGGLQGKIWSLKRKLLPKNGLQQPTAKKNAQGTLVTDKEDLEELYVETYKSRLSPNQILEELGEHRELKSFLFDLEVSLAKCDKTRDWTLKELDVALHSMKNKKSRDMHGHTYELFKYGGTDLKFSLLKLFNRVKKTQTYPSILKSSSITSIWKKKGDQADLENDRGIFIVSKIRSILDKLVYNDIYNIIDNNMSSSNIGARKNRNIRDHLFVINGILNEAIIAPNKTPIDIQIYDVSKCFDKLDYTTTANDLFNSGVQNDKFILVANSNKSGNVSVKLPWGINSRPFHIENVEMQGTVLAPLKCSASIDTIGKEALIDNHDILYKYKNCVTIPPLSMIDDILAVSSCSVNSILVNSMIEAKLHTKNLQLGSKKCFHMHVGKRVNDCKSLRVNNSTMNTTLKEKYLGNIVSADGKVDINITDRYNRGVGLVNQIISMLREIHFGQYYFEMAILLRNAILVNGMLFSIEALYGLKSKHIDTLESVDKYFFRKIFSAHSKTAIEAFYIETGTLPLRFFVRGKATFVQISHVYI